MMRSKLFCILGAFLLLSSCGCARKTRELPEVDPVTFQRYSQDNILSSKVLGVSVKYSVYYPASYMSSKDKRYPVVYMLHGIGDDNNSWNGKYLHANNKIDHWTAKGLGEMIYVFPQGFSSYYCNRYDGTFSYMDMFVNELIPLIDKNLRTIPDKQHRAVTGYSMGGFGAMALAEKHPELFIACAPLSMSVRTDWQYMEESQDGWNNQWGKIFGGYGLSGEARLTDYYKQHCPLYWFNAQNKGKLSTVHWYLICGDNEENLLYANDQLHCVLRDGGYEHAYRVVDGGHSSSVWMPALDEVLPMFDYYMNGGSLWSPRLTEEYEARRLEPDQDGSWSSPLYKESGSGTAVFVAFDDTLPIEFLPYVYAGMYTNDKDVIFLPCPVKEKPLTEWIAHWEALCKARDRQVLGFGEGAAQALEMPIGTFSRAYFIDPEASALSNVAKDQCIFFAGTDISGNYTGMNLLYNLCKKREAQFEYRIVPGYSDKLWNILSSLNSLNSYIIY